MATVKGGLQLPSKETSEDKDIVASMCVSEKQTVQYSQSVEFQEWSVVRVKVIKISWAKLC